MQNQHGTDENALITLAQLGDNHAWAQLFERYYKSCLKLAGSILRDREDAEDEVQNACYKDFRHIGQFQRDAKFSTWLTRIVVNQCLMRMRQQRRTRFVYIEDTDVEDSRVMDLPAVDISPEAEVARAEVAAMLHIEISRIPPLLRHVFVLHDIQQLPFEDVAEKLGISVAACKSRLLRARVELRSRLRKHEGRLGPSTLFA